MTAMEREGAGQWCEPIQALAEMIGAECLAQIGNWCVCPYGSYDYGQIIQATARGLRSAGASERQMYDYAISTASLFIAAVVAGVYTIEGPDPRTFRRGTLIARFYHAAAAEKTLPRTMAVWSEIQIRLWGKDAPLTGAVRSQFPPEIATLDFEASRGIAILLDTFDYVDDTEDGLVWARPGLGRTVVEMLKYKYRMWPIKAFQFAEMLLPYVLADEEGHPPPDSQRRGPGAPDDRDGRTPSEQAQDRQQQTAPGTVDVSRLLDGRSRNEQYGLPLDTFAERLAADAEFRRRVTTSSVGVGPGPAKVVPSPDVLDAIYRQRTANVTLPIEAVGHRDLAFPVAHLSRRPLGDAIPTLDDIAWEATRLDRTGNLCFFRKAFPVTEPISAKPEVGGIPDICFIVDSSGSMSWNWQNGLGPYDCLLRAIYSVLSFLETSGKAPFVRQCVVNFSNTTQRTRWCSFLDLDQVRNMLFRHQGGGTRLNCGILRQVAAESRDAFLALMVTDGAVANADEMVKVVGNLVELGNSFVLIHIGQANPFTQSLTSRGLKVHTITDPRELEGLCLHYTQRMWSG